MKLINFEKDKKEFADYNKLYSEPFGSPEYNDAIGTVRMNLNNPLTPHVPGNPNRILSENIRLSTASEQTRVNGNTVVVGGAGTGKTLSFLLPNLMQMNGSYVISDPGGLLHRTLKNLFMQNGYKVRAVNFINMEDSCKWNPFRYVREKRDVEVLADCFMKNTGEQLDELWKAAEKSFIMALISYLTDIAEETYRNFTTLCWMLQQERIPKDNVEKSNLDNLFEGKIRLSHDIINGKVILKYIPVTVDASTYESTLDNSFCTEMYEKYKLGGKKVLETILIDVKTRLEVFQDEKLQKLTSTDETALDKIGDELTALFIVTPAVKSTYNFLTTALILQAMESLFQVRYDSRNDKKLPYHVAFMLDEFPNIGRFSDHDLASRLSTCSAYNISMTFMLQSIQQLQTLYPDYFDVILGNCDTKIFMGGCDTATATFFSKFFKVSKEELLTLPSTKCMVSPGFIYQILDTKYRLENHPLFSKVDLTK